MLYQQQSYAKFIYLRSRPNLFSSTLRVGVEVDKMSPSTFCRHWLFITRAGWLFVDFDAGVHEP